MPKKRKPQRRLNGEGTIRQRKNGVWEYSYSEINPINGQSERKSFSKKDEDEFYEGVYKIQSNLRKGKATEPSKTLFWDWVYQWLHLYKKKSLKPTTFDSYEITATSHIKGSLIADIPLGKLTTDDLQNFYDNISKHSGKKIASCSKCNYATDKPDEVEQIRYKHLENRRCPKCKEGVLRINKGASIRTLHYLRTQIIGGALEKARITHKIEYNPNEGTEIAKLEYREVEPFTMEQAQVFLEIIVSDKHSMALKTDLGTGLRLGELLSLKWPDIDLDKGTISVSRTVARVRTSQLDNENIVEVLPHADDAKTCLVYMRPKTKKSESTIPIPNKLILQLRQYKKNQDEKIMSVRNVYQNNNLVFCGDLGTQLDPKNFRDHYQYLLRKAGLPDNTFHALRHTFGSLLLEMGEDMKVVQELLRHDDFDTTANTYVKVAERLKQRAATKISAIF